MLKQLLLIILCFITPNFTLLAASLEPNTFLILDKNQSEQWNASMETDIRKVAEDIGGIRLKVVTVNPERMLDAQSDHESTVIDEINSSKARFVLLHSSAFKDSIATLADKYPATTWIISSTHEISSLEHKVRNIHSIHVALEEVGFAHGLLASMLTSTKEIGLIASDKDLDDVNYEKGFSKAIQFTGSDITLRKIYVNAVKDSTLGKTIFKKMLGYEVDVLSAPEDFLGNVSELLKETKMITISPTVQTSVLSTHKNYGPILEQILGQKPSKQQSHILNSENGGISFEMNTNEYLSQNMRRKVVEILKSLQKKDVPLQRHETEEIVWETSLDDLKKSLGVQKKALQGSTKA